LAKLEQEQAIETKPHFRFSMPKARSNTRLLLITQRSLLFITALLQALSYYVLTYSRYEGQGLAPKYFRFTTVSDILSLLIAFLSIFAILRVFFRPRRMSFSRSIFAMLFSALLVWLDYGVSRFDASEFSPVGAVTLIVGMGILLAIFLTKSDPSKSIFYRIWRIIRNALYVFGALCVFSFFYSFTFPTYSDITEIKNFDADAGVVLGAAVWRGKGLGDRPSPTLRQRIDVGYELLKKGTIPRLVVTGASAPGEQAEAEIARNEFIKRGIDPSQLVAETSSRSTLDQVLFVKRELKGKQNWDRFVIISDQYHLARVIEMCRFNGVQAIGSPSNIRQPFLDLAYYRLRESVALLAYWLVGK